MVPGLCSRSSLWREKQCHGELIRSICHLAQDDLKILYKENLLKNGQPDCFIANKFNIEIDSTAPICVTRRLNYGLSFTDIEWIEKYIEYHEGKFPLEISNKFVFCTSILLKHIEFYV